MNKRPIGLLSVTIAILLLTSVFSVVFVKTAVSSPLETEPIGIDDNVKGVTVTVDESLGEAGPVHHSYWNLGDSAIWLRYGSGYASQFTYFTLSYIGTSVEIWVQNSIKFPTGDPRNGPNNSPVPSALRPTKPTYAMLEYYANQFEANILPEESGFFGAPLPHNGSNAQVPVDYPTLPEMTPDYYYEPTGRSVILVSNIRDANYYDPNYPYYVIGAFVSSYTDYYFDRNTVNIDAISWFHGLGTTDMNWGDHYYWPTDSLHNHNVLSPYAYDSTLAHEYQHLLHHELCPGDELWMNEGCSMYAEFLCGYGLDPDYPNSYFFTPDNSLTEWGDQGDINILADYGAAALWTMYLNDRFGSQFIVYYFSHGGGGIDGINATLKHFKIRETFDDVYRDWTLANLIRADFPGCGKYNYKSLNLNDPTYIPVRLYEVSGLPVPSMKGTDFGNTITILGYDTGVSRVGTFGTDYTTFKSWKPKLGVISFDGDDTAKLPSWELTVDGWYSGTGIDLANLLLAGNAYVNPSDPKLTIVTAYGLETLWDFGFVQVSTDGGMTWASLANAYTTTNHDPSAHPDIIANLPGLTDYNPDWPDWTAMDFDLSAYAGQNVMIGFRYMTDWGTTYEGWWINSATVSATALTLAPMGVPAPEVDFEVTVVQALVICGKTYYVPFDMWLKDSTETGSSLALAGQPNYAILVVTPRMQEGTADYAFKASSIPIRCSGGGGYKICEPKSDY